MNIRTYRKVDIIKLASEDSLKYDENSIEKALCSHYKEITLANAELNDGKANKYKICLPMALISFLLLIAGTILLKLM